MSWNNSLLISISFELCSYFYGNYKLPVLPIIFQLTILTIDYFEFDQSLESFIPLILINLSVGFHKPCQQKAL